MVDWEHHCPLCGGTMTLRTARYGSSAGNDFWGCLMFPSCKGSLNLDGSLRDRSLAEKRVGIGSPKSSVKGGPAGKFHGKADANKRSLRRGDLLISDSNSLGPGKLVAKDGENLVLEYFDTPGCAPSDRERRSVPRHSLRRFPLKSETRVFWISRQKWRSGRVIETAPDGDLYVRSHDWEGFVSEEDLFVRWHQPLTDPVGFAEGGLLESPLLSDLRRPFLRTILRQRSAARGMRGALSSSIELHDHQLEAAWRVLQDPVQRYLLADEVGLGKTIEAGIILRQLLLDNPALSVQFILPPFLIGQWQQELVNKFFLEDFLHADIRFARNDEPDTWSPADLLVIDEAHNLAALADSDQADLANRYAQLAEVATNSKRLLMLSATPALNNEPVFLQMLKVLDPAVYANVSVENLRERLQARAGLGRIFLGLQANLPAVLLRNRLAELGRELSGDSDVAQLIAEASDALDSGDRIALNATFDSLRTYVAEIYRVHRRMLRTRRTSALETDYRVTGRRAPKPLILQSGLLSETTRLLEAWRQEVLAAHEEDEHALRAAAKALAEAVNLAFDPVALAKWAASRRAASVEEQTALDRIVEDLTFTRRRETVAQPIADSLSYLFKEGEKVVLFCPTTALVTDIAAELREFLPENAVLEHRLHDSQEHIESVVQKFECAQDTAVLVADSSAEEGRNFQFANMLVHVGVQSEANRMEQRIGRCDRWQRLDASGEWRSLLIEETGASESFTSSWTRILTEGFGVFHSSIATLQFAVQGATDEAWQQLLRFGTDATDRIIESARQTLEEEVERIREQDALDSVEAGGDRGTIFGELARFESGESEFAELTHALLATVPGNLRFSVSGDPRQGIGRYDAISLQPRMQLQLPLVPLERLERDFLPLGGQLGTYRRDIAVRHNHTRLYRYGDPFIAAVSDFLWHDDRGRAFGMWRWIPDWGLGEHIAYRFDYAVEVRPFSVAAAMDLYGDASEGDSASDAMFAHRTDSLFPPLIATVWVDDRGREITNSDLLAVLQEPYVKPERADAGGDFSLNRSRIEAAYRYVPAAQWAERWRQAEDSAVSFVKNLSEVRTAIATGLQSAQSDSAKRIKQLQLRANRSGGSERVNLEREMAFEGAAERAITEAIESPTLRLDSTGIVIISGDEPLYEDNI